MDLLILLSILSKIKEHVKIKNIFRTVYTRTTDVNSTVLTTVFCDPLLFVVITLGKCAHRMLAGIHGSATHVQYGPHEKFKFCMKKPFSLLNLSSVNR
jgi:hypothetical protein